jgi:hypothetical protein
VFLRSDVRLAVLDPALPVNWAADWMGWQRPLDILVDHYERYSQVVAGVTVSAWVTSELWPRRPEWGGDFVAYRHEQLWNPTAQAPTLGGAYQHRLAVSDPALWSQLRAIPAAATALVAGTITRTAIEDAGQQQEPEAEAVAASWRAPDAPRADKATLDMLLAGAFTTEDWRRFDAAAAVADGAPAAYAPIDADDSQASRNARHWYRYLYREARRMEMVMCWRDWLLAPDAAPSRPIHSLADIVYCAQEAGHSAAVAAVVAAAAAELQKAPPQ